MILAGGDAQGVVLQFTALGKRRERCFGGSSQAGDAFGESRRSVPTRLGELVEKFVQGDEIRPFDIPMRLLDLALQDSMA